MFLSINKVFKKITWFKGLQKPGQNRGQAIVEYVLILVVALALGFLVLKLNEGFKKWGGSIVGPTGYMVCLLETGKLPAQTTDCAIKPLDVTFPPSNGGSSSSPPPGSSGPGSGSGPGSDGGNNSGSGGGPGSEGGNNGNSTSNGESSQGGEGTSGDVYPTDDSSLDKGGKGSSSSSGGRGSKRKRKGSSSSNDQANPDGETIALNSADREGLGGGGLDNKSQEGRGRRKSRKKSKKRKITFSSKGSSYNGEPGYAGQRHRAIMSGAWWEQDEQKKRNKPIPVSNSRGLASKKTNMTGTEKRSRLVIDKKAKTKNKDVKIGKWSFGNIFRIILIICVIVAMVLLIGSQTYSVKKSMK